MKKKVETLVEFLNKSLSMVGLPEMTHKKTQVFVEMNKQLKTFTLEQIIPLADDYGLLLPAFALSDVNVDYAKLIQNKQTLDVEGFILYTDVVFLRMTANNKNIMLHITEGDSSKPPKELRQRFIKDTLETFINTKGCSKEEIVSSMIERYTQ